MPEKAINGFDVQREADHLLFTRYAPASAVVYAELKILHVRGHTGPYLELAPGQANLNLLAMTHEALRPSLAAAIEQSRGGCRYYPCSDGSRARRAGCRQRGIADRQ